MKTVKILSCFLIFLIFAFIFNTKNCYANEEAKRIEKSIEFLKLIMNGKNGAAPRQLLSHARAVLIIPGVKKIGFIAAVKRGKGVIIARDKNNRWLAPSFVTITGGSIGFQAGASSSDILILIMTDKALKKFTGNKLKLGADIGIVAGPLGGNLNISQETFKKIDAFSYVKEKGLFAGASISGSVISHDNNANQKFYGTKITFKEILNHKKIKLPYEAEKLISVLNKYSNFNNN